MPSVRARFAPSPTGYVHVGNARTALFNWLFARQHGGAFVLRIEDTDVERSEKQYEEQLLKDLAWFGLDWDEGPDRGGPLGPYRQSERKQLYAQYSTQLIDQGHAYYCFCSAEQLEAERQEALKAGLQPKYSGRCRKRPREEAARKVAEGEPGAIRLKIVDSVLMWQDLVHGPTSFSSEVIGDPILVRSDGHAAYNYAVVIDDHLMDITHVIRGDDHISNTPRQLALYHALSWRPPEFAHLSTILGSDRTPLSKRHGATSLEGFREMGIRPEALRNYLLLLGWSAADGKTEILSTEEMIKQFSLDRITKSPAVFDRKKLSWLNAHYVHQLPVGEKQEHIKRHVEEFLTSKGYLAPDEVGRARDLVYLLIEIIVESAGRREFADVVPLIFDYDAAKIVAAEQTKQVVENPISREILKSLIPKVLSEPELKFERFQAVMKSVGSDTGKKGNDLFHPVRVALTGAESGPELKKLIPIFEKGSQLLLRRHVKSSGERLRELAEAAHL
jgi:glutamyl-tRNA synthetase